ncbi:MFS transporter [Nocardioides massiliensis]|uniref:MFS family arabinose efflux permease n=1 Tax=Nocardioides massiliensis TaxID=1325935 RepID=A0ABT9NL36_9ACTN|nr:MFS transporter [Nocardioides massiliensis]MDP9821136.1 putative MFS family arabinose efflux permease [Nocardioides massiliensis]
MASASGATSSRDAIANVAAAVLFCFSLAVTSLAVPLLAVGVGYGLGEVGLLLAISAISQMVVRLFIGRLMRKIAERILIIAGAAMLSASCAVLALSADWYVFLASQLLQGAARALFWTGAHTHAARTASSPVRVLAAITLASGISYIAGPLLAGLLMRWSVEVALLVAAATAAFTTVPGFFLTRLAPFPPKVEEGSGQYIWRRPGVRDACWMAGSAGAWRGIISSYVPVVLDQARQSSTTIGVLVSIANAAFVGGGALAAWVTNPTRRSLLISAILGAGTGIALVYPAAGSVVLCAAALAMSGLAAGWLETLWPALANQSVQTSAAGDAIASAGTFRAAAMFAAPLGTAALLTVLPLGASLVTIGMLMAIPSSTVGSATRPISQSRTEGDIQGDR